MNKQIVRSQRLGEEYVKVEHPSGLTLLLCPMEGFSTAYALFATKYGSVDTTFKTQNDADFVTVPEGIAHFLEHKLFENEDCDAFALYAKTGASANAYTTFDRTAYLFACSQNFKESLEILLDFVQKPYFTPQSVQKEQGIIGQEIRMYEDNPDQRVFFNLLQSLYVNHPVRIDIAGTVESIAEIDDKLLYRCYETFYNLHNMVLTIAGNFNIEDVLEAADRLLKKAEPCEIERKSPPEPDEILKNRAEQTLPVAVPLFNIGFKGSAPANGEEMIKNLVLNEILMEIICGESSELYRKLYDKGLINSTFAYEVLGGRDYMVPIYTGESRNADEVYKEINTAIQTLRDKGIDQASFERCKRSNYGRYIGMYGRVEAVAGLMLMCHFAGVDMYTLPDIVANATLEELEARLKNDFDTSKSALSVIKPC